MSAPPQHSTHPAMQQQSFVTPATQYKRNCPKCGATIDPELGRCSGCGLLYGIKHQATQPSTAPAIPIPRPLTSMPQSFTGQQPPRAQAMGPQYNNPRPAPTNPGFGQRPLNYGSPGPMPPDGILMPIPRAVPASAGAANVNPAMPTRPYPYQATPPPPAERAIRDSAKRGPMRVFSAVFIVIVCLLIGGGIYFFSHQTSTPPPAPTISAVNFSNVTESSAIITWITNKPATSQVKYQKTENISSTTPLDDNLITSHSVTLTKLDSGTTYNFTIISKDAAGNEATSASNQPFTTLTPIPVGIQVGNRAPDFTLQNLDGQNVTLSSFSGQIVMINFWAVWCQPCTKELPLIQAVSDNWSGRQLVVLAIAVNTDEQLSAVNEFISQNHYTFPVLFDSETKVETLYGFTPSTTIPQTFFIDADGIIRNVQEGSFENQTEITNILDSVK